MATLETGISSGQACATKTVGVSQLVTRARLQTGQSGAYSGPSSSWRKSAPFQKARQTRNRPTISLRRPRSTEKSREEPADRELLRRRRNLDLWLAGI
jgi:hypothetical protein